MNKTLTYTYLPVLVSWIEIPIPELYYLFRCSARVGDHSNYDSWLLNIWILKHIAMWEIKFNDALCKEDIAKHLFQCFHTNWNANTKWFSWNALYHRLVININNNFQQVNALKHQEFVPSWQFAIYIKNWCANIALDSLYSYHVFIDFTQPFYRQIFILFL